MQIGTAESDLRGAVFSVRLSDLLARETILVGTPFQFAPESDQAEPARELATKVWHHINDDPPLPDRPDPRATESCFEIIKLLQGDSLDLIELAEPARMRVRLNLAVASILMHSLDAAAEHVNAVLLADDMHPRALLLKGRICFYRGDLRGAREALMSVRGNENTSAVSILAEACMASGEVAQAQQLYSRLVVGDSSLALRARLLRISDILRDESTAAQMMVELESALQDDVQHPIVAVAVAEHLLAIGHADAAVEKLSLLSKSSKVLPNARLWYAWQVGRMQFLAGTFLSCCDWYTKAAPDESDSLVHREYVHALYRAGLVPAAHRRARAVRAKHGRVVHGITEIEADAFAQAGKFLDARGLITELLTDRPKSGHLLLSLARLYAATGDVDQADTCLAEIDQEKLPPDIVSAFMALRAELTEAKKLGGG